jgi:hypothetical protein
LSQLRQHTAEIESLGLQVLVVTFEAANVAADYVLETGLPWIVLLDPTRSLYTAYEMGRGRWWKIWGPGTWWAYARLLARGERPSRPTGDVDQLGGDVLVDPAGRVVVWHVGDGPADRPAIPSLLEPVRNSRASA